MIFENKNLSPNFRLKSFLSRGGLNCKFQLLRTCQAKDLLVSFYCSNKICESLRSKKTCMSTYKYGEWMVPSEFFRKYLQPHLYLGPFPCTFVFLVLLFIVCNFRFIQPGSTQSGLVHGTCTVGWRIVAGESRGNRGGMFFLFVAEKILPIKSNYFEIRFTVRRTQLDLFKLITSPVIGRTALVGYEKIHSILILLLVRTKLNKLTSD